MRLICIVLIGWHFLTLSLLTRFFISIIPLLLYDYRYLWPLIHYHKFLAKCIKKLKRNGVDVKMSVSPVAAFLREEVCAVSDHLASVSLFDSEEWMACLAHFHGWTDTTQGSEERLRHLVSKLKLKPLAEHGDVDSPLLRSQIDEQFLKAMAEQRKQMEMGGEQQQDRRKLGSAKVTPTNSNKRPPNPAHNGARMDNVPNQVGGTGAGGPPTRNTGVRRQRMAPGYPYHPQWWGHGWAPHQHPQAHQFPPPHHGADDGSVHSSLSGDGTFADYGMYPGAPGPNGQFYYPGAFHPHPAAAVGLVDNAAPGYDPNVMTHESSMYMGPPQPYHPDHAGLGFFGHPPVDPSMAYGVNQQYQDEVALQYGVPPSLAHNITPSSPQQEPPPSPDHGGPDYSNAADDQTPYKYKTPRSPYWSHLDATIAMGLSTPQTTTKQIRNADPAAQDDAEAAAAAANAQPLLLRQSQYYGYGPVSNVRVFLCSSE